MKQKSCNKCLQVKDLEEFPIAKSCLDGRSGECKECRKQYDRDWYKLNQESQKSKGRKYFSLNREAVLEKNRNYPKDKKALQGKRYRQENAVKIAAHKKEAYDLWRSENPKKVTDRNKWEKEKRALDPSYKISGALRTRINSLLKNIDSTRTLSLIEIIGCSVDFLRSHLEIQFLPGMSWINHSVKGWHIDHIIPCSSFDLTDPEQQKACFHWSNLQPLWAFDNLSKGSKIQAWT